MVNMGLFFIFRVLYTMNTVCMWLWSQVNILDLLVTLGPLGLRNCVGFKYTWLRSG